MMNEKNVELDAEQSKILSEFVILLSKQVRENTGDIHGLLKTHQGSEKHRELNKMMEMHQRLLIVEKQMEEICNFINRMLLSHEDFNHGGGEIIKH